MRGGQRGAQGQMAEGLRAHVRESEFNPKGWAGVGGSVQ